MYRWCWCIVQQIRHHVVRSSSKPSECDKFRLWLCRGYDWLLETVEMQRYSTCCMSVRLAVSYIIVIIIVIIIIIIIIMMSFWRQETQLWLTNRATHLWKCNGVADFLKHSPHLDCGYHTEFVPSGLKDARINTGTPKIRERGDFISLMLDSGW